MSHSRNRRDIRYPNPGTCDNRVDQDKCNYSWGKKWRSFMEKIRTWDMCASFYTDARRVGLWIYKMCSSLVSTLFLSYFDAPKIFSTISRTFRKDLLTALNQIVVCKEINFRPKPKKIIDLIQRLFPTPTVAFFIGYGSSPPRISEIDINNRLISQGTVGSIAAGKGIHHN